MPAAAMVKDASFKNPNVPECRVVKHLNNGARLGTKNFGLLLRNP